MSKITEYQVSVLEVSVGETFDFLTYGTPYYGATLVAANYDETEQDVIMTINSTNGLEAIPYKGTVPLLPMVAGQAINVPSPTQQISTAKISYMLSYKETE